MPSVATRRLLLIGLLGAALAIRLAAGAWWQARLGDERKFAFGDSHSYWTLAQSIVRGEPYRYGAGQAWMFRTPGYPVLLAGMFCLTGDDPPVVWARRLGAVLGVAAVAAVVCLTWMLFNESTAMLAGLLATVYPGAVAMSVFVLSEAPFCPLFVAQLICWTAAWRAKQARSIVVLAALAGALAALATLVRPSWLLFTPFACCAGLILFGQRGRQAMIAIVMLAAFAAVMSPWWVRNYAISGRFVATTTQLGASLYDGLHPQATGASDMRFVQEFYRQQVEIDSALSTPPIELFEVRLDETMREAAIDWARRNPPQALRLAAVKALRMWRPWPSAAEFRHWAFRAIVAIGFTPLFAGGIWGAWKFARRDWPYMLCALPAVYFTLLHMIFVGSIRYRQPPMLTLIVLAAGALGPPLLAMVRRFAERRGTRCD